MVEDVLTRSALSMVKVCIITPQRRWINEELIDNVDRKVYKLAFWNLLMSGLHFTLKQTKHRRNLRIQMGTTKMVSRKIIGVNDI